MPLYHLYHLNAFSGHIDRAEDFHAFDNVEAIHRLQSGPRLSNMELWCEGRKISRFDAAPHVFQIFQLETLESDKA